MLHRDIRHFAFTTQDNRLYILHVPCLAGGLHISLADNPARLVSFCPRREVNLLYFTRDDIRNGFDGEEANWIQLRGIEISECKHTVQ